MSIQDGKVFLYISKRKNALVVGLLMITQVILSMILSISLAGNLIWPEQSLATAGAPLKIAYEGRLTDSSGNALGGTGTVYCYRFSIYDAASSGNKLWPAGTPSITTATTTDGVFNAIVGQTDTLSSTVFDFSTTSTAYLQVEVNTTTSTCGGSWEALSPRQQVLSSGYAMQSANVYGSLLKTDTTNGLVQVGAGGQSNPVELALDSNNAIADYVGQTCSVNGTMWYNTVTTQALICSNNTLQKVGTSGTTTIAAITTNSDTPASAGTINFSNSNGVTFGINGNTITASVNAGGGGAVSQRWKELLIRASITNITNLSAINGTPIFQPFFVDGTLTISRINWEMSRSTTGSNYFTVYAGIYSYVNGTQLGLMASLSNSYSATATASVSGVRRFAASGLNVTTFAPGGYVLGMLFTATATASMNYSIRGGMTAAPAVGAVLPGADQYNTATSYNLFPFLGRYTVATGAMPSTVNDSDVRGQFTGASAALPWWVGLNND